MDVLFINQIKSIELFKSIDFILFEVLFIPYYIILSYCAMVALVRPSLFQMM